MRNISAFNRGVFVTGWMVSALFFLPSLRAEDQAVVRPNRPEVSVTETSKPVFDPELFKTQPHKIDDFFLKLKEENAEFSKNQRERKRKFMEKIRSKDMDAEKRQAKTLKFNQKQREKIEKFHQKQKGKTKKYYKKKGFA